MKNPETRRDPSGIPGRESNPDWHPDSGSGSREMAKNPNREFSVGKFPNPIRTSPEPDSGMATLVVRYLTVLVDNLMLIFYSNIKNQYVV